MIASELPMVLSNCRAWRAATGERARSMAGNSSCDGTGRAAELRLLRRLTPRALRRPPLAQRVKDAIVLDECRQNRTIAATPIGPPSN